MKILYASISKGKEERNSTMKKIMTISRVFMLPLAMLSLVMLVNGGPRKNHGGGGGSYGVPEPASIALLGVGLVSLGLYAKRKKNKK
jgi:hypothetical protein